MEDAIEQDTLRAIVRGTYGKIAKIGADHPTESNSCCPPGSASCCGGSIGSPSDKLGYTNSEISAVPDGSNLGLGCGNPVAIASLKSGECVVDLGSGAGLDCFLAARAVGSHGCVIGVDMTPEMISRARKSATKGNYLNVEFRLGEIEHLPIADNVADIIISNCVLNLSPNKRSVLSEAFRVLKPGGRLAISDIVAFQPLPDEIRDDASLLCGCMSGATPVDELQTYLRDAGFASIEILEKPESKEFIREWAPNRGVENFLSSASIRARKP